MLENMSSSDVILALSLAAGVIVVAATTVRAVRRNTPLENRAWTYCPRCGTRRPDDGDVVAMASAPDSEPLPVVPSQLLQKGWCRPEDAINAQGWEVLASDESSVAWSVLGACDRAFEPHSTPWRAFRRGLGDVLARRYGGVSPGEWNDHPSREHETVVALAQEIERRAGLRPCSDG